jgi:hypothetical protein
MHLDPTTTVNTCGDKHDAPPPVAQRDKDLSDKAFVSYSSDAYRCVTTKEADILTMPWGPRMDIVFHPKSAPHALGGRLRVLGRVKGAEIELASLPIQSADAPMTASVAFGCDAYAIRASLASEPPPNSPRVESYVYARVYDGR